MAAASLALWAAFLAFNKSPTARFEALARECQPLAQAICDYRNDHGLLPEELNDLVPDYLPKILPPRCGYFEGVLEYPAGRVPGVFYDFHNQSNMWWIKGDEAPTSPKLLNVWGPKPTRPQLGDEELFAATIAEYEKRISRHPADLGYYESEICFVRLAKKDVVLREECNRAIKLFPRWWFPRMVLAEMDGLDSPTHQQFENWVNENNTYANWWYLARFYQDEGNATQALQALQKSANCKFETYPTDSNKVGSVLAFDAVQFAYDNQNFDLAMKLSRQWEEAEPDVVDSWLAFEAAIEIKQNKFDSATEHALRAKTFASRCGRGHFRNY